MSYFSVFSATPAVTSQL